MSLSSPSTSSSVANPFLAKQYAKFMSRAPEVVIRLKEYNRMEEAAELQKEIDYIYAVRNTQEFERAFYGAELGYYIGTINSIKEQQVHDEIDRVYEGLKRHESPKAKELQEIFRWCYLHNQEAILEAERNLVQFQEELQRLDNELAKETVAVDDAATTQQ
jgi:hypothetical protein